MKALRASERIVSGRSVRGQTPGNAGKRRLQPPGNRWGGSTPQRQLRRTQGRRAPGAGGQKEPRSPPTSSVLRPTHSSIVGLSAHLRPPVDTGKPRRVLDQPAVRLRHGMLRSQDVVPGVACSVCVCRRLSAVRRWSWDGGRELDGSWSGGGGGRTHPLWLSEAVGFRRSDRAD